jgi:hypothetical protein
MPPTRGLATEANVRDMTKSPVVEKYQQHVAGNYGVLCDVDGSAVDLNATF